MYKTMTSKIATTAFVILALTAFTACEKKKGGSQQAPNTPASTAAPSRVHAQPGAQPGSHEDWCGEHEVPESLCTRCNPTLTAAFKATGDWCQEHGLPESQCLICNPELKIERPPRAEKASP